MKRYLQNIQAHKTASGFSINAIYLKMGTFAFEEQKICKKSAKVFHSILSKKRKINPIHFHFMFFFKQDQLLAKNKAVKYAIKLFTLKKA